MKASHATNKRLQHEHKQCKTNSKKNVTMYLFSNTLLQCVIVVIIRGQQLSALILTCQI